jgi:flavin reductase (DIM6/NTAB) family NADH-FMN oxidoreductase RutF
MAANLDHIDAVLRLVNREVWIVTASAGSRRGGLTATWISAASIDPQRPVLLAGIAPNHFTAELIAESGAFCAHLIAPHQFALAWNFTAGSGRDRDKFAGLEITNGQTGAPVLRDCLAWFDCRIFASYDCGDRLLFWGDVVAAEQPGRGQPLREHELIQRLTDDQRRQMRADRATDINVQRSQHDAWRSRQSFQNRAT